MDVSSRTGRPCAFAFRRFHASALAIALAPILGLLPPATAEAVDIHYARAIGQEYQPEPPPATAPIPRETDGTAELPGLGSTAERERAAPPSLWKRVLIGTLVVAAIAALGNGGGSAVSVGTGGGSTPDTGGGGGAAPPDNGGGNGSSGSGSGGSAGGGGGINIDVGLGAGGGDGERGRGRGRGRDDDARGRGRGRDRDD